MPEGRRPDFSVVVNGGGGGESQTLRPNRASRIRTVMKAQVVTPVQRASVLKANVRSKEVARESGG